MRKIIASEYVSLDTMMDEPGLWSMPFFNDEISQYKHEELFSADALILGRVTYDGFSATWPTFTDEFGFADRMNSLPSTWPPGREPTSTGTPRSAGATSSTKWPNSSNSPGKAC